MSTASLIDRFSRSVVPTYGRFPLAFTRGQGSFLWDPEGKRYLDFGAGIAVCSIGHAHPALAHAVAQQAQTLIHTSNLYHTEPQAHLAEKLVSLIGPGKCFFCNSGAEANETLFKLARKFGHDSGRHEILTTINSFHGRTLAGIAATGQDKVKKGFEPAVEGFRHVPFNDLDAMRAAVSDKTIAILVEGIQGEGGVHAAIPEYLLGLRKLCDERKLLLFVDSVQCGMFRTGQFQSYQRILENSQAAQTPNAGGPPNSAIRNPQSAFLPDAISMAKGIAGGLPMGAVWIRQPYSDILGPGTHGTTFGGTPLACAAALSVFTVIEKEKLADNARTFGEYLQTQLVLQKSSRIRNVRGLGLMIGVELQPDIPSLAVEGKTPAIVMVNKLHDAGLLTIPSGNHTIRLLPPLNVNMYESNHALQKIAEVLAAL